MGEREREIQVRSLTGESTTLSISPNKIIRDLKLLLRQTFPPASSSPNFHLFLKGVKLGLQSQISCHSVESGEFIVLVPYMKKDQQQSQQDNKSGTNLEGEHDFSTSKASDSAWSDMMHDLSFLRNIPSEENPSNIASNSINSADSNGVMGGFSIYMSSKTKSTKRFNCDKQEGHIDDLISSMLGSSENTQLDQHNCKRFMQVLESATCLSNPHSGNCVFKEAYSEYRDKNSSANRNDMCLCPSWLKTVMKAFYFLNIYSAYLHLQQETVTLTCLKEVLDQLNELGLHVGIADLKNLSDLCPKVVRFINDKIGIASALDALFIITSPVEQRHPVEVAQKRLPKAKSINALKKREGSFKMILCNAVKLFMLKNGNEMVKFLSFEDLLIFVTEGGIMESANEAKRPRRSKFVASSVHSFEARCHETNPLLPLEMVEHLKRGIGSRGQMVHIEEISARVANLVAIPMELSENMNSALNCIGINELYSHQAESVRASLAGKNVVVATMTSSGKSLCYNLPVLELLFQNLSACALYLFPTKALAQDQLRSLLAMAKGFDRCLNIGIYDGDTPQTDRIWLRENARLLITNPDMLHISILPVHQQFRRILSNLRFVVIDETHAYKGAFGCHTALILRRLRRLCSHVYGSDPSFVFCTATSANPREHAMKLANLPTIKLIQNDGSPSGQKLFILWNPPLYPKAVLKRTTNSRDTGVSSHMGFRRSSPILETACLFAEIVQHGLRCIAFCKSRKLCELVLCYTREILQETAPHLVSSICAYRAGYIAQDRRTIEDNFFSGNLYGVAATNALELGIDVGHIDVTLHLGFPGSIASLWQQAGRSGRREKPSLAIYVAFEGPLDQYFMKFPEKLFRSPIECCHIDAQNQQILEQHLVCAAVEHPLSLLHDECYFGPRLETAIVALKSKGYLTADPSRDLSARIWSYVGHEKMPSHSVSLRAVETEKYKVIDKQKNELLEEIEESRAFFQVYDGAVYMHQGKTYLVKELDLSTKIAFCQVADLKYYTKTRDYTDVHVIGVEMAYPARLSNIMQFSKTTAQTDTCKVTTTWFGFYRIWRGSNQVFDTVDLMLPKYSYESQAAWIRVPQSIKAAVEIKNFSFHAGLHAAGHALLNVVPLYVICNSSDLASECVNPHDNRYVAERILLYDQHPGGTGISAQVQPLFTELLTSALELLTSCCCSGDTGCPNCVQSLACHEYNEVLHKDAAAFIIKSVLEAEKSYFDGSS